jgi:hypothetical protein
MVWSRLEQDGLKPQVTRDQVNTDRNFSLSLRS